MRVLRDQGFLILTGSFAVVALGSFANGVRSVVWVGIAYVGAALV